MRWFLPLTTGEAGSLSSCRPGGNYRALRPEALALAQRFLAAAAMRARAAGLIVRLGLEPVEAEAVVALELVPFSLWNLAQRAFWAALIRARPAALIGPLPLPRPVALIPLVLVPASGAEEELPRIWSSSLWSDSMRSFSAAARASCLEERFSNIFGFNSNSVSVTETAS